MTTNNLHEANLSTRFLREVNAQVKPTKTYATKQSMEKAIAKLTYLPTGTRFVTCRTEEDGRFYPIFLATGSDAGLICQVIHDGFCIAN